MEADSLNSSSLLVRLHLRVDTQLDGLISAEQSSIIEKLDIVFESSFAQRPEGESLNSLLSAASHCPNLGSVSFSSEGPDYYTLPISVVSDFLNITPFAHELTLGPFEIQGSTSDFEKLAESFGHNDSLHRIQFTCWLSESMRMTNTNLDSIARAFAASRSLRSLYINPLFSFSEISSTVVGMLCTIPNLQSLHLHNCGLKEDHAVSITLVLEDNQNIKDLQISCNLGERASVALARCLRANHTLESLLIHNTTEISDESAVGNDDYNIDLAEALGANTTLQNLSLHGVPLSEASQRAFVTMVAQENFTLQSLSLVDMDDALQSEMDKYLLLNESGRKHLLNGSSTTSRFDWIEALAYVSHELDCIFYLLSKNPSLCDENGQDHNLREANIKRRAEQDAISFDTEGKRRKTR